MKVAELAARHPRIGIDSNVVIYALEGTGSDSTVARAVFDLLAGGSCSAVLSVLGVIEVLVGPARHAGDALAQRYVDELLSLEGVEVAGIDRDVALEAAHARAGGAGLADAIHLASARTFGATAFLTNDRSIKPLRGLDVISLPELSP